MGVITIESKAYKALLEKIDNIEKYVVRKKEETYDSDNTLLDTATVCSYLKVSKRTMQRYRSNGEIAYSIIGKNVYYSMSAVRQFLKERNIRRDPGTLTTLARQGKIFPPKE